MLNHRINFSQPFPFSSVPDPLPGLSLEAAAEEEKFLRTRDAEIAHCFGVSPAHMTQKRHTNKSSWDEFEIRWFTEGPAILAATRRRRAAFEQARRERRQQDRDWEKALWEQEPNDKESGEEPLGPMTRFGLHLMDFFCQDRMIAAILVLIALYFAGDFLFHAGAGQDAWQSVRSFLTGVTP